MYIYRLLFRRFCRRRSTPSLLPMWSFVRLFVWCTARLVIAERGEFRMDRSGPGDPGELATQDVS
eukprot:7342721-Pyramimonas_sp.AAC.1